MRPFRKCELAAETTALWTAKTEQGHLKSVKSWAKNKGIHTTLAIQYSLRGTDGVRSPTPTVVLRVEVEGGVLHSACRCHRVSAGKVLSAVSLTFARPPRIAGTPHGGDLSHNPGHRRRPLSTYSCCSTQNYMQWGRLTCLGGGLGRNQCDPTRKSLPSIRFWSSFPDTTLGRGY
jgi:hypothetical protein